MKKPALAPVVAVWAFTLPPLGVPEQDRDALDAETRNIMVQPLREAIRHRLPSLHDVSLAPGNRRVILRNVHCIIGMDADHDKLCLWCIANPAAPVHRQYATLIGDAVLRAIQTINKPPVAA